MSTIFGSILSFDGSVVTFGETSILFAGDIDPQPGDSFFYPHQCVIYRSAGVDASTGDESFSGLYVGVCAYEVNASGSSSFRGMSYQATPAVMIPSADILFAVNDLVVCTTENGRVISGTVLNFEPCPERGMEGTTLWLKNASDD